MVDKKLKDVEDGKRRFLVEFFVLIALGLALNFVAYLDAPDWLMVALLVCFVIYAGRLGGWCLKMFCDE